MSLKKLENLMKGVLEHEKQLSHSGGSKKKLEVEIAPMDIMTDIEIEINKANESLQARLDKLKGGKKSGGKKSGGLSHNTGGLSHNTGGLSHNTGGLSHNTGGKKSGGASFYGSGCCSECEGESNVAVPIKLKRGAPWSQVLKEFWNVNPNKSIGEVSKAASAFYRTY